MSSFLFQAYSERFSFEQKAKGTGASRKKNRQFSKEGKSEVTQG
jgi:hypothetical protein